MLENNWKTWLILLIAFVGASVELLKHLPGRETIAWEKENLHYGADGKPYSVRNELPKKMKLPAPPRPAAHVAGDQKVLAEALKNYTEATAPKATEAEHKDAPAKAAADKKKKKAGDDEYEEVIDPVTGKKVKRKKKKEAKKEEEKPKTVTASQPVTPSEPAQDDRNDAAAIAAAIAESAETGDIPLPIKKSNVDPFMTLQEWERLLLSRPDLAETKVFIQAYKSHTVAGDVYYTIAKMMIADSRPEMKSLGVMVAGSNASVLSFQILAGVASSGTGDPKSNAQKYLDAYANSLANLQVLLGVLRGSDTVAARAALREFDIAAGKFLSAGTTSGGGSGNHTGNATQFQPFVAVLTTLSHSSDSGVASQASSSLNHLESLLGNSAINTGNVAQTP